MLTLPRQRNELHATQDHKAEPIETMPTRLVCTAMYLNDTLRLEVLDGFTLVPFWAWAPSYELDLVAVTRHARRAHRLAVLRDASLCVVLLATVGVLGSIVHNRHGALALAVVACMGAFVGIAPRFGSLRWWSWARWWMRRLNKKTTRAVAEVLLVVALAFAAIRSVTRDEDPVVYLVPLAVGVAIAYVVVATFDFAAAHLARSTWKATGTLADLAPPGPQWLETRLHELESANLLTYDHTYRVSDTMVGAGQTFYQWPITVDTQLGRRLLKGGGERAIPKSVDVVELHRRLEEAVQRAQIPGMSCEYRVYADGQGLYSRQAGLLVDHLAPPRTTASSDEIVAWLREPAHLTRTYLCLQTNSRDGDLVVTTFVRGDLVGRYLHFRVKIFILPPVLLPPPGLQAMPMTRAYSLASPALHAIRTTHQLLVKSPGRLASNVAAPLKRWRLRRLHRRLIRRNPMYDFGAVQSLRERLAVGEHMHSNAWDDALKACYVVQLELTRALDEYLTSQDIDASSLREDVKTIINNYRTRIDRLAAKNVSFGPKSRAGDSYAAKPSSQAPASAPTAAPDLLPGQDVDRESAETPV